MSFQVPLQVESNRQPIMVPGTVCDNTYELWSTNKTPLRLNIEGFYWGSCRQEATMWLNLAIQSPTPFSPRSQTYLAWPRAPGKQKQALPLNGTVGKVSTIQHGLRPQPAETCLSGCIFQWLRGFLPKTDRSQSQGFRTCTIRTT